MTVLLEPRSYPRGAANGDVIRQLADGLPVVVTDITTGQDKDSFFSPPIEHPPRQRLS